MGLLLAFIVGCDKATESKVLTYPVDRTITNLEGKKIQATLIGRSETQLTLFKKGQPNRKTFSYAISQLSAEDQVFIKRLPLKAVEKRSGQQPSQFYMRRVKGLDSDIKEIERKMAEIKKQKRGKKSSQSQQRGWNAQLRTLRSNLDKLKAERHKLRETK